MTTEADESGGCSGVAVSLAGGNDLYRESCGNERKRKKREPAGWRIRPDQAR